MRAGFGKTELNPPLGLQMLGMPGTPRAEGVVWPLHGRVMVLEVNDTLVALVSLDLLGLNSDTVAEWRDVISQRSGIPPSHILIACSHTHRAPSPFADATDDSEQALAFLAEARERVATAAAGAVANLQPAELLTGEADAPGVGFNRRPMYANGEVGTHGWTWLPGFIGLEDTPDETLRLLMARTPDGAPLGGVVDFSCHPTAMGHDPVYSADYPGALTEALEARRGGTWGFLLGAAGDTSTPDPSSHDEESGFGVAHTTRMGEALAEAADRAINSARHEPAHSIAVATTHVAVKQRLATRELVDLALWYLEERPADLDELEFSRRFYGHDYTFADGKQVGNERHAQEMLRMWEWQQGPNAQLVEQLEVQVIAIGDTAIVALPGEIFTDFGRRIITASPFASTMIVSIANGSHGYIPTKVAFSHGGYEPRFALPSRLEEDAGDMLTEAAITLLRQLAA
jgi:neutral ceramidase